MSYIRNGSKVCNHDFICSNTKIGSVDFELNVLSKKINAIQKEIGAKKKVVSLRIYIQPLTSSYTQAKQPADDLVASKKELDEEQAKMKIRSKEAEEHMRAKASTVGNLVAKDVPVSLTEVSIWLFLTV